MKRFFMLPVLALALVACGPVTGGGTAPSPDVTADVGPVEADICLPFAPGNDACNAALERLNHCCWDAFGPSRAFASGLGGQELCERVRASGRDPVTACSSVLAQFREVDPGKLACEFEPTGINDGTVLGVPLCCCHRGFRCTGSPMRCE